MTNAFIIIFSPLLLFVLLYSEKQKNQKIFIGTKLILSSLFVITALLQPHWVPQYYHCLLVGLILCMIGDVCLALPQEKMFKLGLAAFLTGHLFYICGFLSLIPLRLWISPGIYLIVAISVIIFFWLRPYLKSMLVPVLLYIGVITLMVSGAWAVFWKSAFDISGRTVVLAGALSFYFSDLFVARDKFVREEYRNQLIGLLLYYLGQFLLAFSVGLLK